VNSGDGPALRVATEEDAAGIHLSFLEVCGEPRRIRPEVVDDHVARAVESAKASPLDPDRVRAVRTMLKHGRYRATGRGKPAHEFLHKAAVEGRFPRVLGPVDLLNATSLGHGLPMSLVDLDAAGSAAFRLRRGRRGEVYVFNEAGQTIDLRDLLTLTTEADDAPCANPVKDSLRTKLGPTSGRFGAFVYAPEGWAPPAEAAVDALEAAFRAAWPEVALARGLASGPAE